MGEREQAGSMLQWRRLPLLLYGIVLVFAGLAVHLLGTVALVLTNTIAPGLLAPAWPIRLLILSGGLMLAAIVLAALDRRPSQHLARAVARARDELGRVDVVAVAEALAL